LSRSSRKAIEHIGGREERRRGAGFFAAGAPASIHFLSRAMSSALGRTFSSAGGIGSAALVIRLISLDLADSPGTTHYVAG